MPIKPDSQKRRRGKLEPRGKEGIYRLASLVASLKQTKALALEPD